MEGEVFVTGDNSKMQLGIDKKIKRRVSPSNIQFDQENEKALIAQANGFFNVVYTEFGNVYAWGDNQYGQLGTGNTEPQSRPFNVTKGLRLAEDESIVQISLSADATMLLLNNGQYISYGGNKYGKLAVNAMEEVVLTPTRGTLANVKMIAAGVSSTLLLTRNG